MTYVLGILRGYELFLESLWSNRSAIRYRCKPSMEGCEALHTLRFTPGTPGKVGKEVLHRGYRE